MIDLSPIVCDRLYLEFNVIGITDSGSISGYGCNAIDGQDAAWLLRPSGMAPEPSTFLTLALGLATLMVFPGRRSVRRGPERSHAKSQGRSLPAFLTLLFPAASPRYPIRGSGHFAARREHDVAR